MKRTVVGTGLFLCALATVALAQPVQALSTSSIQNDEIVGIPTKQLFGGDEMAHKIELTKAEPQPKESQVTIQKTELPEPVEHVVQSGESLSKIAQQYQTTWKRLFDKNTSITDPNVINASEHLIIPTADEQLVERAIPVAQPTAVVASATSSTPSARSTARAYVSGSTAGNSYERGYCTWYAKSRRSDMPNNLGNAITWVSRAAAQGFATGSIPRAGAIGQSGNHVVYVESVNGDGTVTVSEMNHVGWNVVSSRTVAASTFSYIY